jgi:hypothetical protein
MENPTLRRRSSYLSIDRPVKMIGRKRAYCPAPKFLPVSSISSPSRRMRARHNRQKFVRNFSSRSLYSPWSNITAQCRTTRNCSNLPPNVHKTGKCSLLALLRSYKTFIFRSKMTFSCIWIRTLNFLHDISAPSLYNLDESAQSRNILNFNTSQNEDWISMASTYLHKIQNDGKTYLYQNCASLSERDLCAPKYFQGEDLRAHIRGKISSPQRYPPTKKRPVHFIPVSPCCIQEQLTWKDRTSHPSM